MDIVEKLKDIAEHDWRSSILAHTSDTAAEAVGEIERLRASVEDAIDTLEAMDMHIDNPLYARLRATLEPETP